MQHRDKLPTTINYEELGFRIRNRRKELNIKQSVMAEALGISNNHLSSIEHGRQKLSMDSFILICSYLAVTPDYLILGTMHGDNTPRNIRDRLLLCEPSDVELADEFIELLVHRKNKKTSQ